MGGVSSTGKGWRIESQKSRGLCITGSSNGNGGEEGKKGCKAQFGLRKLQDYSSKGGGIWSGQEGHPEPSRPSLGVPLHPRIAEGCQTLSSHFIRLRETFTPDKGETYLIAAGGWGAERSLSQKASLMRVD